MKIIARPQGTNKTRELLELANENHGLVLTTEPHALKVKAESYGFNDIEFVDWGGLLYNDYDSSRPLYIHKAGEVFKAYMKLDFDLDLEGFSITMEE